MSCPGLSFSLNAESRDCHDLIQAATASAIAFDEAHADNENRAIDHANLFAKFAFAVHKGLIKETKFSIKPEDNEIENHRQRRLRDCIHAPVNSTNGPGTIGSGTLHQLAQSVSLHAESTNTSNLVRIRELDAADRRADEKKDRLSKFQSGTINMISMASSSDSLRAGNVTRTFKDVINSESASLALQTLLTQFKQKGNDTVAFSSGTLQSIWHGNLQPFNENSPSNFSIFTITENKPGQDDGMARIYLHLVSASKNQQVSLESLKASTIQVISTPGNYEELIERLTSYTQWYGLSFGNRSSGHEGLAALVLKFVSLKGLIRARFAANHMYGAMICHAIDTRVHIHLKQCELATEREDVDDSFVNFSSLWQDIQTNQFMIHDPPSNLLQIHQGS